jgi:hypothetical protein
MTNRSLTLLVWLCAALAAACGGDNAVVAKSTAPELPPERVLTRLELAPDSSLLTLRQDLRLTLKAWDQFGDTLFTADWARSAKYVISDSAVVRVDDGILTGLAVGVARVTATLTINDRTLTDSITVTVVMPTATSAVITLDHPGGYAWYGSPSVVSLKAPAAVTWVIPDSVQAPGILLTFPSAKVEGLTFVQGVATRTLSSPGYYTYGTAEMREWNDYGGVVWVF